MDVVIVGGSEAWLLASELAEAGVGVLLGPWRCMPSAWEKRRCHPGLPMEDETSVQILLAAGVNLGLIAGGMPGVHLQREG